MGVIKTIFIIILVVTLLRWLLRPIIQAAVNQSLRDMQKEHQRKQAGAFKQKNSKEGSINISTKPQQKDKRPDLNKGGEYVDFEEIK